MSQPRMVVAEQLLRDTIELNKKFEEEGCIVYPEFKKLVRRMAAFLKKPEARK